MLILALAGCGGGTAQFSLVPAEPAATPQDNGTETSWPSALPRDVIQPWEQLDGNGRIAPARSSSGINQQSDFTSGVDRFSQSGNVTDNGEASRIESTSGGISSVLYRIPYGSQQPGAVSVDANLLSGSGYYLGIADYATGRWLWHGPFTDNHVRISTARLEPFTSTLGSLYVSVLVHDGAAADVVGIGVNPADFADAAAPPSPTGLSVQPVSGGLLLDWDPVPAGDLAGYRIYHHSQPFINGNAVGVQQLDSLQGSPQLEMELASGERRFLRVSALDFTGNESPLSELVSAAALDGAMPELQLSIEQPSGMLNDSVQLTASGAESYDFDLDGDGIFDLTGSSSGSVQVDTSATGIIRPAVRATGPDETAVALGSISLLIAGNSRPVAEAMATPTSGTAPLEVSFSGGGSTDFDGSIVGGGWDFDGDGAYDVWDDSDIVHVTGAMHTYMEGGVYNARLRVLDDSGAWDVDTLTIVVDGVPVSNVLPVADLQSDVSSGNAPLTVRFDASASTDGDGGIVEYAWDFDGNGTYEEISDSPLVEHLFSQPGSPLVRMRVEDTDGARATTTLLIEVNAVDNSGPLADLQVTPSAGDAPLPVTLDASGSTDLDGSIVKYEWDFDGDGFFESYGSGSSISHVYNSPGVFSAKVRVTDDAGAQDLASSDVTVSVLGNDSPTADLQLSKSSGVVPLGILLDASASMDTDGTIVNYEWDFEGDGYYDTYGEVDFIYHTYQSSGILQPTVRITDDKGAQDLASTTLTVNPTNNMYPIPVLTLSESWGYEGLTVTLDASGSSDPNDEIVKYEWDFTGDGAYDAVGENPIIQHSYNNHGVFNVTLRVTDSYGLQDFTSAMLRINEEFDLPHPWGMNGQNPRSTGRSPWIGSQSDNLRYTMPSSQENRRTPAISADGNIYITDNGGLIAYDKYGNELWSFASGATATASPAIGIDGAVYFGNWGNRLYAINPDGTERWFQNTIGDIRAGSVLGPDGSIYFANLDGRLYARNPDGSIRWFLDMTGACVNCPVLGPDGAVYCGTQDDVVYAVNPDGSVRWTFPTADAVNAQMCLGPDGTLYVSAGLFYAIKADGTQAWNYNPTGDATGGPSQAADGTIYFGDSAGELTALNPDGSLKWTYTGSGQFNSCPTVDASGNIYFADGDGNLTALKPDASVIWTVNEASQFSTPVIGPDGTVYSGSGGITYAFGKGPVNLPPTSTVIATPTSGDLPLTVFFDTTGCADPDGSIVLYEWDCDGDGAYESYGTGITHEFTYMNAGIYSATLRVTDNLGSIDVDSLDITVNVPGNDSPTADLQADVTSGDLPLTVNFDASNSSDPDGTVVLYEWDCDGDGSYEEYGSVSSNSFTYQLAGVFTVTLRVTDDAGAQDTDTIDITVNVPGNTSPNADLSADVSSGDIPLTVNFNASASNDPDGTIVLYEWDFDGDEIYDGYGDATGATHVYTSGGSYTAKLRVTDDDGAQDTDTFTVTATVPGNNAPNALLSIDQPFGPVGHIAYLDASGSTDSDGSIVEYAWDWDGDGNYESIGSNPLVSHQFNQLGFFNVTVRVKDDDGAVDTAHVIFSTPSEWGQFRMNAQGIAHSGIIGPQTNNELWTFTTGDQVQSSPTIAADGTIYVCSQDNSLYAINPDGSLAWSYATGDSITRCAPAVAADGTIYVCGLDNKLHAVNPDGSGKWTYTSGNDIISGPVIDMNNRIYFGSRDDMVHCVNPDGSLAWSYLTGNEIRGCIALGRDGSVYAASQDENLYAITPNGNLKWTASIGQQQLQSPLVGADGNIYISASSGLVFCFDPAGNQLWSINHGAHPNGTISADNDGFIYVNRGNGLRKIDDDGNTIWTFNTADWVSCAASVDAAGNVYFSCRNGNAYCLDSAGNLVWSASIGDVSFSSPAITRDGRMLVGSHFGDLYCFGAP
ncbi:PQQ-binding-like beta-propeller repeat protein [bacterium]|nr:PQQ-binding-like beta-propeller repeat protein [bacterium]